jgi:hypothetical protein
LQDRNCDGALRINPSRHFVAATSGDGNRVRSDARPILRPALSHASTEDGRASVSSPIDAIGTSPSSGPGEMAFSRRISNRMSMGRTSSAGTSPDGHWGTPAMHSTLASTLGRSPVNPDASAQLSDMCTTTSMDAQPPQYMGVRQLVRSLLNGPAVLPWLDSAVDACSHLVNLRTVIGQYRGQRVKRQHVRPEVARMQQAFERDVVALRRYCLLLAYAAFLDRLPVSELGSASFSDWTASMASVHVRTAAPVRLADAVLCLSVLWHRADWVRSVCGRPRSLCVGTAAQSSNMLWILTTRCVRSQRLARQCELRLVMQDALLAPLRDPMHALTPITPSRAMRADVPSRTDRSCAPADQIGPVPEHVAQLVLRHRMFRMLTPHTILKSPHLSDWQEGKGQAEDVEGVAKLLRVTGLPIWLASNPSLQVRRSTQGKRLQLVPACAS